MKLLLLLATASLVLAAGTKREKRQNNYYGNYGGNYGGNQGRANVQVTEIVRTFGCPHHGR